MHSSASCLHYVSDTRPVSRVPFHHCIVLHRTSIPQFTHPLYPSCRFLFFPLFCCSSFQSVPFPAIFFPCSASLVVCRPLFRRYACAGAYACAHTRTHTHTDSHSSILPGSWMPLPSSWNTQLQPETESPRPESIKASLCRGSLGTEIGGHQQSPLPLCIQLLL